MRQIKKRSRRFEFIPHPELNMGSWIVLLGLVVKMHIPFYIFLAFYQDYLPFLATMDAIIVVLIIFYIIILKPLMMRGIINGYYRRKYEDVKSMIWSFFIIGATVRTVIFGLYYSFIFWWVSGDQTKLRYTVYLNEFQDYLFDVFGIIAGAILCGYLFYSLFYKERFITIRDFSVRVEQLVKQCGYGRKEAIYQVFIERSRELEQNGIQQVPHRYSNNGDISADLFRKNVQTHSCSSTPEREPEVQSAFMPMRRQSRK